ncbi:MAG: glycosyltransferase family 4 protein [Terracidiphilus sp.]
MRIALFTETFLPKLDGIVTTLCQTVRQLKGLGHEVLIFAPGGGPQEFEGCRVVGIRGRSFPFYPELRLALPHAFLRQTLKEFQPDVIHAAEPVLLGTAALYYAGGREGGGLRLPLLVSYHTDLPKYLGYYRLRFLEPYIWGLLRLRHNRATINLCTSHTMVRQLEEHGIARVKLWPGGVDAERFHPGRRSGIMRNRLTQGHPESPLLLYVGRLSPEKEIERLLPILEAVPGARLALVGDGPHRPALEHYFAHHFAHRFPKRSGPHSAGAPVFTAGFLEGDELADAYASSDLFLMPSRSETLGLVVLEAMASGLPVVAARAGGIPEMIEDGVSGFLFDSEAGAAATVQRLLASAEERDAVGRAAREHALQWGWKMATCRLVEHYQAACTTMQQTGPDPKPAPDPPTLSIRARRALSAATLFTIRRLLP